MEKKNAGFLGLILAATMLLRTGSPETPPPAATRQAAAPGGLQATAACPNDADSDGPWNAAQAYFQLRNSFAGDTCKPDPLHRFPCVPTGGNTRFLIATIPDPDATHLALYFDRNMESLLSAASDAGYSFERYWLPWNTEPPADLILLQDRECQRKAGDARHGLPGLLVFHDTKSPRKSLFLFLVGETPSYGVNKDAWNNALAYVTAMEEKIGDGKGAGPKWNVDVVGPGFSGSLAPLAAALARLDTASYRFHFVSGMATSTGAIADFRTAIAELGEFRSLVEGDERAMGLFQGFVDSMWSRPMSLWSPQKKVAILTESGTAYGTSIKDGDLVFRYPREISRLRNTYPDSTAASQAGKPAPAAPGVQFTLKDAASESDMLAEKDSVPTFSRLQSPASQQALLSSIGQALRQESVDLGGIVATDILDGLFLSRFLRTVSPDTRAFTLDADLLFLPWSDRSAPTGMLSITTYPLLRPGAHGTRTSERQLTQFASRYAQGTYNACAALLAPTGPYPPGSFTPPRRWLWLTAVGRDGFWPVARLDARPQEIRDRDPLPAEPPGWAWFLLFWVSVPLSILHSAYSIDLCRWPRGESPGAGFAATLLRAYPDGRRALCAQERAFLSCISLAAACGILVVALPLVRFAGPPASAPWAQWHLAVGSLAILSLLAAAAVLVLGCGDVWRGHMLYLLFPGFALAATFSFAVVWVDLTGRDGYATGYYFAYRCLGLTSGLAPNLPVVLMALGFVWWGCARLKACGMIEERSRILRLNPPLPPGAALIRSVDDAIGDLFSSRVWAPAIPFVVVWFGLFVPWRTFQSLEYKSYDVLYTLVVLALCWAVAVSGMQFRWCWRRFRVYLQWLERQPGRDAFDRLRKDASWVPLVTAPGGHSLFITSRSWDCLKAILSFRPSPDEQVRHGRLVASLRQDEDDMRVLLESVERDLASGRDVDRERYGRLQVLMEKAAASIVADLQCEEWDRGASDSLAGQNTAESENTSPKVEPLLVLKEEFVALRTLVYVRYVFRHLRVLLGFVVAGFILSVLSMSCYSFQGHRWIGGANAVVCLALGLGIVAVFAEMDRDAIMSRITKTKANELGMTFFIRVAQYGVLPLATLASSQFPEINRFLFSWLQPAIDAIK